MKRVITCNAENCVFDLIPLYFITLSYLISIAENTYHITNPAPKYFKESNCPMFPFFLFIGIEHNFQKEEVMLSEFRKEEGILGSYRESE